MEVSSGDRNKIEKPVTSENKRKKSKTIGASSLGTNLIKRMLIESRLNNHHQTEKRKTMQIEILPMMFSVNAYILGPICISIIFIKHYICYA